MPRLSRSRPASPERSVLEQSVSLIRERNVGEAEINEGGTAVLPEVLHGTKPTRASAASGVRVRGCSDQTKARDLIAPVKSHFRGGNQRPSLCTVIDNALMWKRGVAVDTNRGKKKVGRTKNRLTVVPSGPAGKERDGKSHGREVETTRLSIT